MMTWHKEILPKLDAAGIHIHMYADLSDTQKAAMHTFFVNEVFPVLTPLAFDSSHPFPFISNLSLNLAIIIRDPAKKEYFARVKVPTNLFSRLVRIPGTDDGARAKDNDVHLDLSRRDHCSASRHALSGTGCGGFIPVPDYPGCGS